MCEGGRGFRRCHWMGVCLCASCRSTQQGAAPPKPPAAPRSGAAPAPLSSPLILLLPPSQPQPQPEIRGLSRPRPSWGRASRWLQGLGGRVGRPETKPVQQSRAGFWPGPSLPPPRGWADSRGPARHWPGAGPPPPPSAIPDDRCQGAVCSLPGVNFLLETIKLLRAEGAVQGSV